MSPKNGKSLETRYIYHIILILHLLSSEELQEKKEQLEYSIYQLPGPYLFLYPGEVLESRRLHLLGFFFFLYTIAFRAVDWSLNIKVSM